MANQSKKISTYMRLSEDCLNGAERIAKRQGKNTEDKGWKVAVFEEAIAMYERVLERGIEEVAKEEVIAGKRGAAARWRKPAPAEEPK